MTEMQDGTPLQNGVSEHITNGHSKANGYATPTSQPDQKAENEPHQSQIENQVAADNNGIDLPPLKKRKLTEVETRKATGTGGRHISPPWKRIEIHGPTSFVENGRRKSGRTNFVPEELQPQPEGKVRTRGAIQQRTVPAVQSKYGGAAAYKSSPLNASASTQMPGATKRSQSAGKAIKSEGKPPPAKKIHESSLSSKQAKDASPLPRRSHKKKVRPPSPTPDHISAPETPQLVKGQKRKVGRPAASSKTANNTSLTNGLHKREEEEQMQVEDSVRERETKRKPQRLNLRIHAPTISVQHPEHIVHREMVDEWEGDKAVRKPKFSSFEDWLEKEGRLGLETGDADPRITDEEARREASIRTRISYAARPGGVLSAEKCSVHRPEGNQEPPRLYTHQDRLIYHARFFHKLLNQERGKHLRAAKECAEKAAAWVKQREEKTYREWRQVQPKTADEIRQEQDQLFREIYVQLKEDMKRKWAMVNELVHLHRQQRWQEEQERIGNEALNEVIEKAKGALNKRRKRPSEIGSDEDSDAETDVSENKDDAESTDEDESNMSSSQSDSEEDQVMGDDDEDLTQEQLLAKYAAIPSAVERSPPASETNELSALLGDTGEGSHVPDANDPLQIPNTNADVSLVDNLGRNIELEEVDAALMDDSDASTDMDDDDDDSEDESRSEDFDDEDSSGADEPSNPLLGFFGNQDLQRKPPSSAEAPAGKTHKDEMSEDEEEEVSLIPDATQGPTPSASTSEEPQPRPREEVKTHPSQNELTPDRDVPTLVIPKAKAQETQTCEQSSAPTELVTATQELSLPATPVSAKTISTSVPSLIRGTLREYQHFGLDWLAGLYANNENGILADEMGLGKTIQTIALLAHLAEKYEIWGPHLIVVPTSVMLNWEMEFKKFLPGFKILTYYGTKEERLKKRQGMSVDKDKWNVWITSYQLVVNDQQVFKRKAWHYMILDEAHNIKNFQSVRWQTLLTYNTHSRLLLTGTPLQNNLTELWSLLFFLSPEKASIGDGFFSLDDFNKHFKRAESQVLESGREAMNAQSREMITNLHQILRPHLLRRLKADVEKQMPGKYEHVVYCRLSKRQRYLYDAFMSRAQTRETLASSNTFSIMNALMQLRKVCNHPDLFETRDIKTSFAMPKSVVADFEIKELLVRRRMFQDDALKIVDLNMINLLPGANEQFSALDTIQRQRLGALGAIRQLTSQQWKRVDRGMKFDGTTVPSTLEFFKNSARDARFEQLRHDSYLTSLRSQRRPLFSHALEQRLRLNDKMLPGPPAKRRDLSEWFQNLSPTISDLVQALPRRSESLEMIVRKFACITPKVVATDMADIVLTQSGVQAVQKAKAICPKDPYHEARVRLSIAFPDKRLLQYDCGKLQRLDGLLRTLQSGGHRALIFTQMTKVLDILEQFLNIHGHRYLRLDGATKVEQRQALTERFNSDNRILAFILSSRSGGIGINLTGADTVIFYDMDWNPAMDKQCQDRCHRIGQTRDVHIYRMVSEHTIEGNILRKANQKRMLDDVVIQEGDFTTDYFNSNKVEEIVDEEALMGDDVANEAMDRVLGGRGAGRVLEQVEDLEDTKAAKQAEREIAQNQDAADFDEKGAASGGASTPKTPATPGEMMPPPSTFRRGNTDAVERTTTIEAVESGLAMMPADMMAEGDGLEEVPSCDDYMLRLMEWEMRDVPVQPSEGGRKKKPKGKEHTLRKR